MEFSAIIYVIFFIVGMYGLYQIKHGYKFKGLIKLVICLAVCSIVAGNSGVDNNSDKKSSQPKETKTVAEDWNKNFDDPQAIPHNMSICHEKMSAMNGIAKNAHKVSPAEVMKNPADYLGVVLDMGATVKDAKDFDKDSGGELFFDGKAHSIVAIADDGTYILAARKGHVAEHNEELMTSSKVGEFTIVVGMLAGITTVQSVNGGDIKALFIVGDPKH